MRWVTIGALLLLAVAVTGCPQPQPPSPPTPPSPPAPPTTPPTPIGVNRVVNMIPLALSGETNQDSEPFLTAEPGDPDRMAGTAFTPNPFGSGTGLAPIYVSDDAGDTWALRMTVPSAGITGDITVSAGQPNARLYGSILRLPGSLVMSSLLTDDFLAATAMTQVASRGSADQPFIGSAEGPTGDDHVYIGNNDFNAPGGRTATVDVSGDSGQTYNSVRIESRNTSGQNGPSVRTAVAPDGTVYAAYFGWRAFNGSIATSDLVVVRDDAWATGAVAFRDLVDPGDGLVGRRVVQNLTIPWSNAPTLGNERIGSTLSIAVDPNDSDIVYVTWADRVGGGDIYTVHLRRSLDRGVTWSNDLRTITNATCISLAVADNGAVGFLYQQVVGGRWQTHLEQSRDGFTTLADSLLADVPTTAPPVQFLPYIGDYNYLIAVGNEFRGIFSANNRPLPAHFPSGVNYQRLADFASGTLSDAAGNNVAVSIDPFYFSVDAIP